MSFRSVVLDEISEERDHQLRKWGEQTHDPAWWYVILGEEFGEAGREIFEHNDKRLREELIQVAAVAVAWLEDIDGRSVSDHSRH